MTPQTGSESARATVTVGGGIEELLRAQAVSTCPPLVNIQLVAGGTISQ